MIVICYLKGIYRSIKNLMIISGHDYQLVEENDKKQVLECIKCKHKSIAYKGSDKE